MLRADWRVLSAGRWNRPDHVTLGEGRAHVRIAQALASIAGAHRHRIIALEDNAPIAFSMAKGRSPAYAIDYPCRHRAAASLAAQMMIAAPWVQSADMPADEASRRGGSTPRPAPERQGDRSHHQALQGRPGAGGVVPH